MATMTATRPAISTTSTVEIAPVEPLKLNIFRTKKWLANVSVEDPATGRMQRKQMRVSSATADEAMHFARESLPDYIGVDSIEPELQAA